NSYTDKILMTDTIDTLPATNGGVEHSKTRSTNLMSTKEQRTTDDESIDPEELLPEHSVLKLEEYLAMQDAIGNETRFRILYALKQQGEMSANQLKESLEMRPNNLHYHLDKLCDVGLVQNRKQSTP